MPGKLIFFFGLFLILLFFMIPFVDCTAISPPTLWLVLHFFPQDNLLNLLFFFLLHIQNFFTHLFSLPFHL